MMTTMALRAPLRQLARRSLATAPTAPRYLARQQSTASGSSLGDATKRDIAVSIRPPLETANPRLQPYNMDREAPD